jgi:hypothetical protein
MATTSDHANSDTDPGPSSLDLLLSAFCDQVPDLCGPVPGPGALGTGRQQHAGAAPAVGNIAKAITRFAAINCHVATLDALFAGTFHDTAAILEMASALTSIDKVTTLFMLMSAVTRSAMVMEAPSSG